MNIKNIIFDWGGVISEIDYFATINAFKKYGVNNFEEHYCQTYQSDLFILHETGKITADEFRSELRKIVVPITDEQLDRAWMAMLKDTPSENITLLKYMKVRYRTFLLSNTNAIHVARYGEILREKFGFENGMIELFEKVYYSHEVGIKKPDPRIFEQILLEKSLIPSETLFVDDTIQNIESAKSLGIKTYLVPPEKTLKDIIKSDEFKIIFNDNLSSLTDALFSR